MAKVIDASALLVKIADEIPNILNNNSTIFPDCINTEITLKKISSYPQMDWICNTPDFLLGA